MGRMKDEGGRMSKTDVGNCSASALIPWAALALFILHPSSFILPTTGSGGIRTLSISRSEREWSAGCLPSRDSGKAEGGRMSKTDATFSIHPSSFILHLSDFGKEDSNLHCLIQSQGACRLADSRERPAGVEPAYQAWDARAWPLGPGRNSSIQRKERELNPQGSSLARVRVGCRRQSACPSIMVDRVYRTHETLMI